MPAWYRAQSLADTSWVSMGGFSSGSVVKVKNPPAVQELQEMQVQLLGSEDTPEEGMESHSRILAWRIPWTEKPGKLRSIGLQRVGHD